MFGSFPHSKPQRPPLTALAKKYGHPVGRDKDISHSPLKGTGKSGLTPLSPFRTIPGNKLHPNEKKKQRVHQYQRQRFFNFTAAELDQIGSMAGCQTMKVTSTLDSPIHPMFEKSKWDTERTRLKHLGFIPIYEGRDGCWQVDNPEVWHLMRPALQLASRLLTDASYWPWWDALFNGDFREIESSRKPADKRDSYLLSFHPRPPAIRGNPQQVARLQQQILGAAQGIRFGMWSGYTSHHTGLPNSSGISIYDGVTDPKTIYEHTKVWVGVELLQPLLRTDLTDAERLSCQFKVASTLIHESAHAVWDTMRYKHGSRPGSEPYFDDERLPELGWSLEDKVIWGGQARDIANSEHWQQGPGAPNMGIIKGNWFTAFQESGSTVPLGPKTPLEGGYDPYYINDSWPISTAFQMRLFQSQFWNLVVRSVGASATHLGPLTVGTRRTVNANDVEMSFPIVSNDILNSQSYNQLPIHDRMSDNDQAIHIAENARRAHANMIRAKVLRDDRSVDLADLPISPDAPGRNSDGPSEYSEDVLPPTCDRWSEIIEYLLKNRGPCELALDTMNFDIPENTLYGYIMARGGLSITPTEFRNFLKTASYWGEYFRYIVDRGGWIGLVHRVDTGWPPNTQSYNLPHLPEPSAANVELFNRCWSKPEFLMDLHNLFNGFPDMDYEALRGLINLWNENPLLLSSDDIAAVVAKFAIDGKRIIHGPAGIVRILPSTAPETAKPYPKADTPITGTAWWRLGG